jgi:hypothetical protein
MVLLTLINISLDISANLSWWVVKNTIYGTYYIVTYITYKPPKLTKEAIELIELKYLISELNNKLKKHELVMDNNLYSEKTDDKLDIIEPNLEDEFILVNKID